MLRSMLTAISALGLEQNAMDVISNNIANVNTQGFKASRSTFQDQFSQIMAYGAAPTTTRGGIDPMEIGLGSRLGAISREFSQGSLVATGRNLDLSVQGDGFFIYQDPNSSGSQFYSRDGSLEMDSQGYLVNIATGYKVLGWTADASGNVNTGNTIAAMQIPLRQTKARATAIATLSGNLDSNIPVFVPASTDYYNATMAVYDSLGVLHNVTIQFTKNNVVSPVPTPPATAVTWDWNILDSGAGETGSGQITFDADGQYVSQTFTAPVVIPGSPGAVDITLADSTAFDLTNLTQMSNESNVSLAYQNGLAAASVQNFIVDANNGDIYAVYGNGLQDRFGRLSLATFTNPEGLTQLGKNMYTISLNSGVGMVGWPGNGGKGTLAVGYNEGSNVDLGSEFTNMILAERGFQAASRMITTSDEMLQELVNLKR